MAKKPKTLAGDKPPGKIVPVGQASEVNTAGAVSVVQASAQAVKSLSVASSTATATGHLDIAAATDQLQASFQQNINNYKGSVVINQVVDFDLAIQTENQINHYTETLKATNVPFFDCDEKYQACLRDAKDGPAKWKCRAVYAACLGYRVSETLRPIIG